MKRFDMSEGERFLFDEEIRRTLLEIEGREPRTIEDYIKVLEYYAAQGERVCCEFNSFLMHSDNIQEIKQAGDRFNLVLEKYSHYKVDRIKSLKDFEDEVAALGDYRDPANHPAYMKMMYKVSKMLEGFEFSTKYEGIDGTFKGYYPESIMTAIYNILKKHLPSSEEFFDESGNLKPELNGPNSGFYTYLGNFVWSYTILANKGNFMGECSKLGLRYIKPESIEEIKALAEESRAYSEEGPSLG